MVVEAGQNGDLQAGATTGGLCAGGSMCNAQWGCNSGCDHQTGLNWIDVSFIAPITNPVVVSQIQTHTGGDWVKTRQRNLNSDGIQMRMEEDNLDGGHNTELFGWYAIPAGSGSLGGLPYEAIATPDAVTHNDYDVTFTQTFGAAPALFAAMHTYDGGDPSHMRLQTLTRTGATMFVEEETCTDAELAHTTETVGVLAVQKGSIGSVVSVEVGSASADLTSIRIPITGAYSKCSSSLLCRFPKPHGTCCTQTSRSSLAASRPPTAPRRWLSASCATRAACAVCRS